MRGPVAALLATVALLLLALGSGVAGAAPASFQLARARAEYERGEYQRVVDTLAPELYPKLKIANSDELKDAHYLLGSAYFFLSRPELARQEFTALLFIDPGKDLDPAIDPPRVYAFFQTLKRELADKLRDLEQHRPAEQTPSREVLIVRTVREPASALSNFVPLGYGQLRNGQVGKGVFFFISEAVFGGASVGLFTYQAIKFGLPARYTEAQRDELGTLRTVQIAAGGVFLALYGIGVYDSFASQRPLVEEKRSERPLGAPVPATAPAPEGRDRGGASWRLVPIVGPEGVGVSALGRF